jgi:O-antigen ligase
MSALTMSWPANQRIAVASVAAAAALVGAAAVRFGPAALALPLVAVGSIALLQRARLAVGALVALLVVCEGRDDDFLGFASAIYQPLPVGPTPLECLLALAVVSVLLDRLSSGRSLRLAGPLTVPLALVVLATATGAAVGAFADVPPKDILFAGRQLLWLAVVPLLVVNVVETERQARAALLFGVGLAVLKAALGLAGVAAGVGLVVEGATITYYEPTANWLALLALLGVVAALLLRARPPAWAVAGAPLLVLSLALSFRRSFWIGAALGVALVCLLGSRPLGRRLVFVSGLVLAAAVWLLSFQPFTAEGPIVERARSLEPTRLEQNAQDRYRVDELANVMAEIRASPLTGLGLGVEWTATRPLAIDHDNGREYTHVVVLWWWLKLGLLGLIAYLAVMACCMVMGWQVWRRSADPLLSAAGLALMCGFVALAAVETVGSFTGVEPRLTALVGAAAGLLVVMRRLALRPG